MFKVPEKYRIREGNLASDSSFGCNGAFMIPLNLERIFAFCIASDGQGFEHVSVSLHTRKAPIQRTPTWEEMCVIKSIFWDSEDCVMQLHPPKSEYVNNYKTCLHLWRPIGVEIPRPNSNLVGIKT
jgi:hypothetical protein